MKNKLSFGLPLLLLASFTATAAQAQSSVTLYGIIDLGVDYANNIASAANGVVLPGAGQKLVQMQSGVPAGSRWGLRGSEDLGDGLKTIFKLESGFNAATGAEGGGLAFSRNAYVGLQSNGIGTVTLGKQWDANVDIVEPFSLNGQYGGWYFSHPNDMDNMDNGFAINNAVKYVSPTIAGFTFEGHYSLGGQAGQFSTNSSYSAALGYNGGAFSAGVGYLRVNDPITAVAGYGSGGGYVNAVYGGALANARSQGVLAAGAGYTFGAFKLLGDVTNTSFQSGTGGGNTNFQNYEVSGIYSFTSAFTLGAGYTYTVGHDHMTATTSKYQQVNAIAQYSLSSRTSVYAMGSFQHASGDGAVAQIAGFNPSSTANQVVTRVGMTHSF